jgi:arginine repressor
VSPKTRRERELAILRILVDREVHTQGELVAELQGRGFVVTQATVSRDIRRLGILKLPSPDGAPRYVSPDEDHLSRNGSGDDGTRAREQLAAAVRESVLEVDSGEALLAVRWRSRSIERGSRRSSQRWRVTTRSSSSCATRRIAARSAACWKVTCRAREFRDWRFDAVGLTENKQLVRAFFDAGNRGDL